MGAMATTETERIGPQDVDATAADVAWDLDPLLEGPTWTRCSTGPTARRRHRRLPRSGRRARRRRARRVMQQVAELQEHLGRAGYYAGLRFAVDTTDPSTGALMQRSQERATAIATRLVFFELEWAAVADDARRGAARRRARSTSARTTCARPGATAPHLLTEPEEKILAEKDVSGRVGVGRGCSAS